MARREFMSTTQVLMVVFLVFFMFQSKVASRIGMGCTLACHVDEGTRTQEHADTEDDSGDENGQGDYDYYRSIVKGFVPSSPLFGNSLSLYLWGIPGLQLCGHIPKKVPRLFSQVSGDESEDSPSAKRMVPRLHCVVIHGKLTVYDYLQNSPPTEPKPHLVKEAREALLRHLTSILGNDGVAAHFMLLHLLSRVHARADNVAVGKLSLNLTLAKRWHLYSALNQVLSSRIFFPSQNAYL
ncbi:PREDICTED: uncharacterized protein LOC105115472 [Populus euphratica]|uniref:Uncharacterized protein LOC105115472 n=1 Tax=Populus euphratica TaxID=75702 RepID=A0AAJ6X9T4_POPEU|nr:PREDICTED: uncharacterized protein LOC105115472 [Populus euphratica]